VPGAGVGQPGPLYDGQIVIQTGYDIMNGKKPKNVMILIESKLITRDNVKDYQGWSSR
jgi:ribose transport system substrate-binding protein